MFAKAYNHACFLMSLPFILLALILSAIVWLCHKVATTLDPSWSETVEREALHKENEP